jgi:hypothetical protein
LSSKDVFTGRVSDLRTSTETYGDSTNSADPHWLSIRDESGTPSDLRDTAVVKERFSREQYAKEYIDSLNAEGGLSYKSAAAAKVRNDILAAMERDLRMRHRGRVRMIGHAFARMRTHGLQDGVVNRHMANFVKILSERR